MKSRIEPSKVGCKVGAIVFATEDTIYVFGHGIYLGPQPCPYLDGMPNPAIKLTTGEVVYGCECYWLNYEEYTRAISKYPKLEKISVAEYRKQYEQEASGKDDQQQGVQEEAPQA